MYGNRPLYATDADARLFVWTAAGLRLQEAVERGQHTLLIGEPGSGKTSLLHRVERDLRKRRPEAPVCYVSLAHTDDVGEAIGSIVRSAYERTLVDELPEQLIAAAVDRGDPFAPTQLIRWLGRVRGPARMLVDDVRGKVGQGLFGRLRDELWQLNLTWAVAVTPDEAAGLLTPPADAFFERRVALADLEPDERETLLEKRNEYGPDTLSATQILRLARDGPGNPRQLIGLARDVAESAAEYDPGELFAGVERRRELARTIGGRPAAMLVAELEGLGPISASDPRLLDRLGWTRPRASEVLGQLEEHGIVSSYPEPRDGRAGRPRKLYELKPPEAFLP